MSGETWYFNISFETGGFTAKSGHYVNYITWHNVEKHFAVIEDILRNGNTPYRERTICIYRYSKNTKVYLVMPGDEYFTYSYTPLFIIPTWLFDESSKDQFFWYLYLFIVLYIGFEPPVKNKEDHFMLDGFVGYMPQEDYDDFIADQINDGDYKDD